MSFDLQQAYTILRPHFQERLRLNEPLAAHCAFGVGGPADMWVTLERQRELIDLVNLCAQHHWPLLLVGGGRNVLFADAGVRGIVAHIDFHSYQIDIQTPTTALFTVEAGAHWSQLLDESLSQGWSGLEFGIGIPGTLGAGIISNAGAHNRSLGEILEWIEVLDARGCNIEPEEQFAPAIKRRYSRDELDLSYRHSRFRVARSACIDCFGHVVIPPRHLIEPAEIVLLLGFRLHAGNPQQLLAQSDRYLYERRQHEPDLPHTGPIFKDPSKTTARELLEQAGLRGQVYGQVQMTERNANYLTNLGGASADDLLSLIITAHQQVLTQCGIDLALNIDLLGEWPHPSVTSAS